MSASHLRDLRYALEASHWQVIGEGQSEDDFIVAVWEIARPDGSNRVNIEFRGDPFYGGGPIEDSHACQLREAPEIGLYFARIGRSWKSRLSTFLSKLDGLSSD